MDKSLVNLDALSKPLTKLIEVVAGGIGTLYAPFGTVRNAKADAKAMIIRANTEKEIASLNDRAHSRLMHQESLRQENLESISNKAAYELPDTVSDKPVDQDWLLQFLNRAQDVCDEEMQIIWARILAGEVAKPGTYAKRTLQFLESLDKTEAEAFTKLCSYTFRDQRDWFVLFLNQQLTEAAQLAMGSSGFIDHFIGIGLISSEIYMPGNSDISRMRLSYFGKKFELIGPPKPEARPNQITMLQTPVPFRMFTQVGQQLAQIAGATETHDFIAKATEGFAKESEIELHEIDSKQSVGGEV